MNMKTHAALVSITAIALLASGCFRTDATATVDRGGHALVLGPGASGSAGTYGGSRGPESVGSGALSGPPRAGESVIVLGMDEPLYQVADERGISLRWLIERNDLVRRPGPGDRIIVPEQRQ